MSTNPQTCKAEDPATCRYHGHETAKPAAQTPTEFKAYEEFRKQQNVETSENKSTRFETIYKTNNYAQYGRPEQIKPQEEIAYNAFRQQKIKETLQAQEAKERDPSWDQYSFQPPQHARDAQAEHHIRNESIEQTKNLTEQELHAIRFYSSNNYKWINGSLYGNTPLEEEHAETQSIYKIKIDHMAKQEILTNPTKSQAKEIVEALDNIIAKAPQKEKTLYRGQSAKNSQIPQGQSTEALHKYVDENYQIGKEITYKGYLSSTPSPKAAMGYSYSEQAGTGIKQEGIFYELKTKNGLNISNVSLYSREIETILPRNTKWKIVAIHKSKNITHSTEGKLKTTQKVTLIQMVEIE